jgi:hypothetical protein
MATKKETQMYAATLALYEKLIATNPAVERKGDTMPYTSLNGHMFSLLAKDGSLGLRLSKEDRDKFIVKYDSELMKQYGVIMKEYVIVPNKLLANTRELKKYFDQSYEYVKSLKPKPTTKTKMAKKKK